MPHYTMSSPWKKQPEDVADCVLKRAEVSKVSRGNPPSQLTSCEIHLRQPGQHGKNKTPAVYINRVLTLVFFILDCPPTAKPPRPRSVQD